MHNDSAAVVGGESDVAGKADRLLKGRVGAPVELVLAGDASRLLRRSRRRRDGRRRCRVVVVEELGEERTEAQLTPGARVVGDEDAQLLVWYEREIRMEPARVAAMSDDA